MKVKGKAENSSWALMEIGENGKELRGRYKELENNFFFSSEDDRVK